MSEVLTIERATEDATPTPAVHSSESLAPIKRLLFAATIAFAFFAAVAPTLDWLEFSTTIENLNVETALEIRRGGPWLVPTLMGEPRVRKPPLCAWITASAIDPAVVANMSSLDTPTREAAWKTLAWQARWPALLAAAFTLALAYELGYTLLGHRIGLIGALSAGSMMLFLKYATAAATDVHLALWVTAANVCIVKVIFERRIWLGCIGAGIALGLGVMSKGPVTFVMTLVPALIFVLWRWRIAPTGNSIRPLIAPITIATLLTLAVGGGWFFFVLLNNPQGASVWWIEVLRTDPSEEATASWFDYFKIIPFVAPWCVLFLVGLWLAGSATVRTTFKSIAASPRTLRLIYAGTLLLMPIVVMSLFRDRKPRYLYPFAVPAGILSAYALVHLVQMNRHRFVLIAHWLCVAAMSAGIAIAGTLGLFASVRADGTPWFDPRLGYTFAAVSCIAIVVFAVATYRRPIGLAIATFSMILTGHALLISGERQSMTGDGLSEMLPVARVLWERYPDAQPYDVGELKKRIPPDLAIYMNRPIRSVKKFADMPVSAEAQVYIDRQKPGEPEPVPAPGFSLLMKTPRDKDLWVAFARPGTRGATSQPAQ